MFNYMPHSICCRVLYKDFEGRNIVRAIVRQQSQEVRDLLLPPKSVDRE